MWPLDRLQRCKTYRRVSDLSVIVENQDKQIKQWQQIAIQHKRKAAILAERNKELEAEIKGIRYGLELFMKSTPFWTALEYLLGGKDR